MQKVAQTLTKNRDRRYKHLLDAMPIYLIPILPILFVIVVAGGVVLGALAGPPVYATQKRIFTDPREIGRLLNGTGYITSEAYAFGNLNQEITVTLTLKNKLFSKTNVGGSSLGIQKNDLLMSAVLMGKNDNDKVFKAVNRINQTQTKVISCPQRQQYCDPLVVAYLAYIPYSQYRVSISFLNVQSLYQFGMFDDYAEIKFEYVKNEYSRWAVGWRYTLLFIIFPFSVFFALYTYVRQQLKFWTTEQKYSAILLLIMILYNNPVFGFHFVADSWVLPFLDNVFLATFFCYLLLAVLVTVHGAIKPVGERGWWFYLPKLILIGAIWAFVIAALTYIRVQEQKDPSYSLRVAGYSSYQVIGIFIMFAAAIYILFLAYYLFRGFGYFSKLGTVPAQFRSRILVVWFLTLAVIVGTIVDVALYLFKKTWNNSAQFLSYYVLYNAYAIVLAIFYLPSFTEKQADHDKEDRMHIVDEESELEGME